MAHLRTAEPLEAYGELVETLFRGPVPLAIMTATFVLVGACVLAETGDGGALAMLLVGCGAAVAKAHLIARFRSQPRPTGERTAGILEHRFAAANSAFAVAIGSLAARTFVLPGNELELLGSGMLFGFCSGQVVRLSTRPRLAILSIFLATVPCAAAAAARGNVAHLGLAAMFLVFMVGSVECIAFLYRQTNERIAINRELAGMAAIDPLTGVRNRLGLWQAIERRFAEDDHSGLLIGIHWLDLDGFKGINDRFGHSVGDALLVEIAGRARDVLRDRDTVARVGGDEFVVLQADVAHGDEADLFARRLLRAITQPYTIAGHPITIGASVGSCTGRPGVDRIDDLLGAADTRMYQAKRAGGGIVTCTSSLDTG